MPGLSQWAWAKKRAASRQGRPPHRALHKALEGIAPEEQLLAAGPPPGTARPRKPRAGSPPGGASSQWKPAQAPDHQRDATMSRKPPSQRRPGAWTPPAPPEPQAEGGQGTPLLEEEGHDTQQGQPESDPQSQAAMDPGTPPAGSGRDSCRTRQACTPGTAEPSTRRAGAIGPRNSLRRKLASGSGSRTRAAASGAAMGRRREQDPRGQRRRGPRE